MTAPGGDTSSHRLKDDETIRVPLVKEQVTIGKVEVERVSARIALRTHHDEVAVSEALRTENADIQRVAVDRIVSEPPVMRVEDGVTIIPVVEEVLVRQFRIIEEIRVTSHVGTIDHAENMVLRRQEATITEDLDNTPVASAATIDDAV